MLDVPVERTKHPWPPFWTLAALLAGLAFSYWVPFNRIGWSPTLVGTIAIVIFAIPVLFAGILFSTQFRRASLPSAALGANMLGAVAGGLLENLSLIFGMRALLLVAIAIYFLAGVGLWRKNPKALARA